MGPNTETQLQAGAASAPFPSAPDRLGRGKGRITSGFRAGTFLAISIVMGVFLAASVAWGAPGDTRATLYIGTTTFTAGGTTTTGTTFGGSLGFELVQDLMLVVGGGFSATDGEKIADDGTGTGAQRSYPVSTTTAEARVGVARFFNRSGVVIPYVGGGLTFLNYEIDHTYPGSEMGKNSGTAPGVYAMGGLEVRMTRNTTMIFQLGVQTYSLESETGESVGGTSGGLSFSLRISA